MAKFLYLFTGGEMAATPEAQEEQMQEWISLVRHARRLGGRYGQCVRCQLDSDERHCQRWGSLQTGRLLDHQRRISRRGYEEGRRMSRPALWWQR